MKAMANAVAVAVVVALMKSTWASCSKGVLERMWKNSAGSATYRMKKFIQARPASGICRSLPQAKPMKIRPKNGRARLMMSSMVGGPGRSVPETL